jgi:AAA family ATP:ADP antiporter
VLAEMWSAVVLSVLFWGFANEVTKVNEAKRFYAIFALGANCSGIFAAFIAHLVKHIPYNPLLPFDKNTQWVFYQLLFVLFIGIVIISLFYWLNRSVFHMENVASLQIPKKAKKLSLGECFKYLRQSRYLAYIVILVISYNVVYNLADVMWTAKVQLTYVNSLEVNNYMNQVGSITGVIAVIFAFIISGNVIRYYGWTTTALITPIIWLVTSLLFFAGLIFHDSIVMDILAMLISNPANFVLFLGSMQICFGRACKYTVFDETKEIAFIPLSKDNQRKSKAIVDGLASRFGKSGGSLIYIILFMLCGNINKTIPYVSVIIILAICCWIYAVYGLGKMVNESIDQEVDYLPGENDAKLAC